MRTTPTTALALCLLTPVLALAQSETLPSENQLVVRSSAFWFWILATAIAVVAFIVSAVYISRHDLLPRMRYS